MQTEVKSKPRGRTTNFDALSRMFSVRTKTAAEQQAIIRHARENLGISANEFILLAIRRAMPAMWIEQPPRVLNGRHFPQPPICSRCGYAADVHSELQSPTFLESVKAEHEFNCWGDTTIEPIIAEMIEALRAAKWTRESATVFRDPEGNFYRGPLGAFLIMRRLKQCS